MSLIWALPIQKYTNSKLNDMKNFLLYLWQLPQNIVGLICLLIWKPEKRLAYKGLTVNFNSKFPSGISLGNYIILKRYPYNKYTWDSVKHEYGHHLQSVKWGCLYLFVIGIPSICGNIWDRLFHGNMSWAESCKWYYNQPWEKSADELGGVERKYE